MKVIVRDIIIVHLQVRVHSTFYHNLYRCNNSRVIHVNIIILKLTVCTMQANSI